ncbi:hypothetical protein Q4F19_03695 [Sphingomonas sp. BIUV-7]|uniref:Uncharacterized protein n=1 Tax=Sphingomonas natans TaxID=3063330 RepID=A0ABT8Y587_9SPHN|nr:hypothetical protein [Sphingomonas sp. BIUV-7]MDO6413478.1 hypothetical protein [Sphingomonas sp. BIUV-7]
MRDHSLPPAPIEAGATSRPAIRARLRALSVARRIELRDAAR